MFHWFIKFYNFLNVLGFEPRTLKLKAYSSTLELYIPFTHSLVLLFRIGFEPTTQTVSVFYSTPELSKRKHI